MIIQTFLPYPDYERSAAVLDRQRLGKQRVEAWQILQALRGESKGWTNHPATCMWRGYEYQLCLYGMAICNEWRKRGYKDTMWDRFFTTTALYRAHTTRPSWLGDEAFHRAHQSNLLRKDPAFYRPKFPKVPNDLPYVWPGEKEAA